MAVNGGSRRYIGLLAVLVLALLSWWLLRQERGHVGAGGGETHLADYSMRDFEMTLMDDAGAPRQRMTAITMVHYGDDDTSELEQPRVTLFRQAGEQWQMEAERARVAPGGEDMVLQGRVLVHRLDVAGNVRLELETRDLHVDTAQQRAGSEAQVEIRDRHGITRAQGLKIDIKAGQIELLAAVRGEYVRER